MARAVVKSHSSSSIGSVKQSMLDEATFQSIHGTGWVLMDGRGVTAAELGEDSDYFLLTGFANIPDARGQFLRGKDHGRNTIDAKGNPDDLNLGDYQADATNSSSLTYEDTYLQEIEPRYPQTGGVYQANFSLPRTGWSVKWQTGNGSGPALSSRLRNGQSTQSIGGGEVETRTKNTTVNIFIKINE